MISTNSRFEAEACFKKYGVAAFGRPMSTATLADLASRDNPQDGIGVNVANMLAESLPKYIHIITGGRTVRRGEPDEADPRYVVSVFVSSTNCVVEFPDGSKSSVNAGAGIYAAAESGIKVTALDSGKVFEYTFVTTEPWEKDDVNSSPEQVVPEEEPEVEEASEDQIEGSQESGD